jgi:hypothetical protein
VTYTEIRLTLPSLVVSLVGCPKVRDQESATCSGTDRSDVQMMDDRLASYWSEFLSECLAMLGTFALVAYTFPLLSLFFIPLILFFVSLAPKTRTHSHVGSMLVRRTIAISTAHLENR